MLVLPILLLLIYGSVDYHYNQAPKEKAQVCEQEADKDLESEVEDDTRDNAR